jgi:serine-type D-Ala-D-Ala carboxypeptidase (penicillin-binding protein 5/6)
MTKLRFIAIGIAVVVILGLGNTLTHSSSPTSMPSTSLFPLTQKEQASLAAPDITLPVKQSSPPAIAARSYIVIDGKTKYPFAAKNADQPVPIASTTKVMTSMVVLEILKLDQVVTVSRQAATIEGSEIQLMTGEKMTVENLLYALLLNSGNDAAYALAEANGTVEDFVEKMNAKAHLLGLRNTQYKDPAGLDTLSQSTPRDLAILTSYALENPVFRKIINTPKYTVWSADNRFKHDLTNSNRLVVPEEPLYLSPAIGGKTGFTFEAGHCLVTAAKAGDGSYYVAVVLHTFEDTKEASAREVRRLLSWALTSS